MDKFDYLEVFYLLSGGAVLGSLFPLWSVILGFGLGTLCIYAIKGETKIWSYYP